MTLPTDAKALLAELSTTADQLKAQGLMEQYLVAQTVADQFKDQTGPPSATLISNARAVLRHFGRG